MWLVATMVDGARNIPVLQKVLLDSFDLSFKIPRCLLDYLSSTSTSTHGTCCSDFTTSGTFLLLPAAPDCPFSKWGLCIYSFTTYSVSCNGERSHITQVWKLLQVWWLIDLPSLCHHSPSSASGPEVPSCWQWRKTADTLLASVTWDPRSTVSVFIQGCIQVFVRVLYIDLMAVTTCVLFTSASLDP